MFYLAPNEYGYKAIAFPADITAFPKWFTDNFKIDRKLTESKMIDSKIEKTFETLEWEVPTPQKTFAKKAVEVLNKKGNIALLNLEVKNET